MGENRFVIKIIKLLIKRWSLEVFISIVLSCNSFTKLKEMNNYLSHKLIWKVKNGVPHAMDWQLGISSSTAYL